MYAGFWKRLLALILDLLIVFHSVLLIALFTGLLLALLEPFIGEDAVDALILWVYFPVIFFCPWIYSAVFESSEFGRHPANWRSA